MKALKVIIGLIICQITFGQIPSLSVQNAEEKQDLEISQLKVSVEVVGNISTTTFDIVFYNPFNRVMEGELSMPLSEGQEICRYALDIEGKLREGVIVEKIKARQTFEAVVRQNIDPGIANMTKGNFFATRIFPIPANGSKRVVLAVSETLHGDDENLYYALPLETSREIGEFKLDVKVVKNSLEENNVLSGFENIQFDNRDDAYFLTFERKDFLPSTPLNFTIPKFFKTNQQLFTGELDGETYFYLVLKTPALKSVAKEAPERIDIYWDNSFSAANRDINTELDFLKAYLTSIKGEKEVKLYAFNHKINPSKTFGIYQDATELIDYIKQLNNDGATCLESLKFDNNCDEILLFSDAINTIGEDPEEFGNIPVYAISSGKGSNYSFLKRVAALTKGEFIDLNYTPMESALKVMLYNEERFLSCYYENSEMIEVLPDVPTRLDGFLEIAGIFKSEKGRLEVNYGYGNTITETQSIEISKTSNAPVSRIWAEKKIEALEMNYEQNQEEIFQLGRKFNIITPNTAFIVLDRVEDYVQYKIIPPDEFKEEYNKLLATSAEEPEVSPDVIQERNLLRIEKLKSWYLNPSDISSQENVASDDMSPGVFYSAPVVAEEMIPNARNQGAIPPPPPPPIEPMEDREVLMEIVFVEEEESVLYNIDEEIPPELNTMDHSSIKILAWLPDAPYMEVLRNAVDSEIDSLYFVLKEENINRPSFYIQVADFLFEKKMSEMAIRVLSNTLELDLENPELLKVVAKRLVNEGEFFTAIEIYKEIKKLRPEEPQSYRDLALAYMANGQFQYALDWYVYILDNEWNIYEEIKDVVLNELNNLILLHKAELNMDAVNTQYINPMPLDIRITIDWSSNDNDIDLWVIDPNGEKCFYQHQHTEIGGKISTDFTQGYGPEEFSLKNAKRGIYTVYVNYFSESRQTITGPVTVYATLCTGYGTNQQETQHITVQLAENKETRQIGQLEFLK